MWSNEHEDTIIRFLKNTNLTVLIACVDPRTGFHVCTQVPAYKMEEIAYLIRQQGVEITPENIGKKLQFGTIKGNYIESLLRVMTNVYAPLIFGNRTWPDSILDIVMHNMPYCTVINFRILHISTVSSSSTI